MFCSTAELEREALLRHISTDEYPVTAKATIGMGEPSCKPAVVQSVVTPKVNSMGSTANHKTPRFLRPKRVMISRISSACSTRL